MGTKDLINAALAKATQKDAAAAELVAAQEVDTLAAVELAAANKAAHDDLAANGQALYVTGPTDAPVYQVAAAAQPDTFTLTEIRLA